MILRVVQVEWEDAASSEPWEYTGELMPAFDCVTVGILLKRDKDAIHLTTTLGGNGGRAGRWRIPAGMVKKVTTLSKLKVSKEPD